MSDLEEKLKPCNPPVRNGEIEVYLNQLDKQEKTIDALAAELEKWRNWKPDDDVLRDSKAQACDSSGEVQSLAGATVYIGGLEVALKKSVAENAKLREALKFYADEKNWDTGIDCDRYTEIEADTGDKASAALSDKEVK